jgi:uncharacterized protein YaaQ
MKLMMMVVRDNDDERVVQEIVKEGFRVTRVASTGGFLRRGNVTLLAGVEDDKVQSVVDILQRACGPADPNQHRATVFVVDMPYYTQV